MARLVTRDSTDHCGSNDENLITRLQPIIWLYWTGAQIDYIESHCDNSSTREVSTYIRVKRDLKSLFFEGVIINILFVNSSTFCKILILCEFDYHCADPRASDSLKRNDDEGAKFKVGQCKVDACCAR